MTEIYDWSIEQTSRGALPPDELKRAELYYKSNYHGCFRRDAGIEILYDLLHQCDTEGLWIDLAAGPFSAIWALAIHRASCLIAVDSSLSSLWLGYHRWHELLESTFVKDLVDKGLVSIERQRGACALQRRYVRADVLAEDFRLCTQDHGASLITVFGLFGLVAKIEDAIRVLRWTQKMLRRDGMLVGASWLSRHGKRRRPRLFETWPDNFKGAASRAGLAVVEARALPLPGDNEFLTMYAWAARPNLDLL